MSSALDKLFDKRMESVALKMIKFGENSFDRIAEYTGLTLETIQQLAASVKATGD